MDGAIFMAIGMMFGKLLSALHWLTSEEYKPSVITPKNERLLTIGAIILVVGIVLLQILYDFVHFRIIP